MSVARTFKKTVLASAIAAILPHVAFAATITVSPSSPDQISLPDATGVVDEILFETNGQTVEKHLGVNKDIDKLTVTEALQKPLLPSRMEQKCSVQFFLTTPGGAVFFTNIIVKYYYDHIHNLVILWKSCSMAN